MKAIIFDPYLDTLGGGERYIFTFAEVLLTRSYEVNIVWDDKSIVQEARNRFGLDLKRVNILPKRKLLEKNLLKRFIFLRKYDLLFWISDGSIPVMLSRKNILHFQVPFHDIGGKSYFNRMKLKRINTIVCNSFFTKRFIDREYGINSQVLYPPVDVEQFKAGRKANIILAVGRFEATMQAKRQDILIDVFREMINKGLRSWRLVLAGASLVKESENKLLQKLKKQAQGLPVDFRVNIPFKQLISLYSQAKIFWHAAGYGIDESKHPERVEHFGMTTVEAVAAGCWPLVYNAGGQREIFSDFKKKDLVFWLTKEELLKKTLNIIGFSKKGLLQSSELLKLPPKFSVKSFTENVQKII